MYDDAHFESRRKATLSELRSGVSAIAAELQGLRRWLEAIETPDGSTLQITPSVPTSQNPGHVSLSQVKVEPAPGALAIYLSHLVDRDMLLSAVDVSIFSAIHTAQELAIAQRVRNGEPPQATLSAADVVRQAHDRLHLAPTEQTTLYFTDRCLKVQRLLQRGGGESKILTNRIEKLAMWHGTLEYVVSDLESFGEERRGAAASAPTPASAPQPLSGKKRKHAAAGAPAAEMAPPEQRRGHSESSPFFREVRPPPRPSAPTLLDVPACVVVPAKATPKGAPPAAAGYVGSIFLGIAPLEYAQILLRRVVRRKRERDGNDSFNQEEKDVKEGLAELQSTAEELRALIDLPPAKRAAVTKGKAGAAASKSKKQIIPPLSDTAPAARPKVALAVHNAAHLQRDVGGAYDATAALLQKKRRLSNTQQERENAKRRTKVAKTLNKAVLKFWSHCGGIRKKATDDWVSAKKQVILESKKQQLLEEADQLAKELREQMSGSADGGGTADSADPASSGGINAVPTPVLLTGGGRRLRVYQQTGLNWLVAMYEKGLSGILADEMGLGKTIQTIALITHVACHEKIWGPHLVIVPTSVLLNWEIEFKRWAPGMKLLAYYGTQATRKKLRLGWTKPGAFDVCVVSYQTVMADAEHFRRIGQWYYMILDEAHMIKNWRSKKWQILQHFKTARRLLLSGTPLQNNLMEIWSLLRFLMHDNPLLASDSNFNSWFNSPMAKMIESGVADTSVVEQLHSLLRPFVLRRLKRQVESQMPKKIERVIRCRLSKRQRTLYDEYLSCSATKNTLDGGGYIGVVGVLMALRKVCNHPSLFEPRPVSSPFCMHYTPSAPVYTIAEPPGPAMAVPHLITTPWHELTSNSTSLQRMGLRLTDEPLPLHSRWDGIRGKPAAPAVAANPPLSPRRGSQTRPTKVSVVRNMFLAAPAPGFEGLDDAEEFPWAEWGFPGSRGGAKGAAYAPVGPLAGYLASLHAAAGEARRARAEYAAGLQARANLRHATRLPALDHLSLGLGFDNFAMLRMPHGAATPLSVACAYRMPGVTAATLHDARRHSNHFARILLRDLPTGDSSGPDNPAAKQARLAIAQWGSFPGATPLPPPARRTRRQGGSGGGGGGGVSLPVRNASGGGAQRLRCPTRYERRFAQTVVLRPLVYSLPAWAERVCYIRDAPDLPTPSERGGDGDSSSDCDAPRPASEWRAVGAFDVIAWGSPDPTPQPRKAKHSATQGDARRDGGGGGGGAGEKPPTGDVPPLGAAEAAKISRGFRRRTLQMWGEGNYLCPDWGAILASLPYDGVCVQNSFWWPLGGSALGMSGNAMVFQKFGSMYVPRAAAPVPLKNGLPEPQEENLADPLIQHLTRKTAGGFSGEAMLVLPDSRLLEYDCGKLQALSALLPRLKEQGHRVLIFTQMSRVLDILESYLAMNGHVYLRLDGATKIDERQYKMEQFNSDTRYFCFILSTRSGGVGINLTGADTVIFYDSDWNPAMDLQAQDRCHRIGQTRDVTVYRLVSKHTLEEKILLKARQKKTLVNLVIKGGNFGDSSIVAGQIAGATTQAKTNVLEFFHHLDDDEMEELRKAENGVEISDNPETAPGEAEARADHNPLLDFEEGVDREAYEKVRAEMKSGQKGELGGLEADEAPAPKPKMRDGLIDVSQITPLQAYALRVLDETRWVDSEAMVRRARNSVDAFRETEFKALRKPPPTAPKG